MTIIGIDPGAKGAIAWQVDGGKVAVSKMPETEPDICALLREIEHGGLIVLYIEDVPIGMPGKGAAMAKLNRNAGYIRGVVNALGIPMVLIRPAKWQAEYGVGKRSGCKSDSEWKNKLKQVAQRLFPDIRVTLDTADALLILDYARKHR
jgi:hypothetical protein